MAECQYKICSICKGVNHTAEYKLKASNFFTLRVDLYRNQSNLPATVPPPMLPNSTDNKSYTAVVCAECVTTDTRIKAIEDTMLAAKANDVEILAGINA